jgi:hypothetical protein
MKKYKDTFVLVICLCFSFIGSMVLQPAEKTSHAAVEAIQEVLVSPTPIIEAPPVKKDQRYITIKAINKFLKNKLENKGAVIYDACKAQDPPVSATLATSIILVEVGSNCNSSVLNKIHNVGGINWFEGCGYPKSGWYIDFTSHGGIDASITMKAKILSRYIREGRTDIVSIGRKYAPPDDPRNGIGGMDNTSWPSNVEHWYNKINRVSKTLA